MLKRRSRKSELDQEALRLWRELALMIWGSKCLITGEEASEMHHFISQGQSRLLKHDVINAVPLAMRIHKKIHSSAKPNEARQLKQEIRDKRGKEWCDYIDKKERLNLGGFYGEDYLEKVITELRDQLDKSSKI